jgi:large subunit ribosomal protein L29
MARKSKTAIDEMRALSDADLAKQLEEDHRQFFTARLQLTTRQLANTSLARKTRRRIARIKTIQRERELAAQQTPGAEA